MRIPVHHVADIKTTQSAEVTIVVGTGATFTEALRLAVTRLDGLGDVLILPSSLRRDDRFSAALRHQLRTYGVASHVVLPVNPVAELIRSRRKARGATWTTVPVMTPEGWRRSIELLARLLGALPVWSVTNIDAVSGSGPYVLDLLARYVHPLSRLRQLARRNRADAVVEVNLAVTLSRCVIGKQFGSFAIAGVTADRIAGELFALALAEEDLSTDRVVTGPWEDRVVQRATELELGAPIPQQISILPAGRFESPARAALERVASRIGVRTS